MKLRKEFINAIITDRTANADQWQLQIERIQSNYVLITDLLKKEQTLSPEEITHCQDFQGQLIDMLAEFIRDMDELDENLPAPGNDMKDLFERHIQRMAELNGHIYEFLNSRRPPSRPA